MYRSGSSDPFDGPGHVAEGGELFGLPPALARSGRFEVSVASAGVEVAAAIALRHRVLAEEIGVIDRHDARRDLDVFDPYCRHLIVRERHGGGLVGTCRLLLPAAARRVGSLCLDGRFELGGLARLRDQLVEVGRLCVAAEHRNGLALMLLWRAVCRFTQRHGHRYLIGSCLVPNDPDGSVAGRLHHGLESHRAAASLRIRPKRRPMLVAPVGPAASVASIAGHASRGIDRTAIRLTLLPPAVAPLILRASLLAGARVLGEPCHDARHRCSELPLLLDLRAMDSRFGRRLML